MQLEILFCIRSCCIIMHVIAFSGSQAAAREAMQAADHRCHRRIRRRRRRRRSPGPPPPPPPVPQKRRLELTPGPQAGRIILRPAPVASADDSRSESPPRRRRKVLAPASTRSISTSRTRSTSRSRLEIAVQLRSRSMSRSRSRLTAPAPSRSRSARSPEASAPNSKRCRDNACIGLWNLGVPEKDSCMATYQEAFDNDLQLKMTSIANMGFNVLLLHEVNAHWAEKARQILSRSCTWNSVVGTQSLAILAKDWVERMVVLVVRLLVGWVVGESCFRVVCYVCVYDVCVYDVCMCVCVCLCVFVCVLCACV